MRKLTFRLDVDQDGWPPVAAESVWCEQEGDLFRVRNTPFFVKEIAYDDLVRVVAAEGEEVVLSTVIEQSGNSTIWLYFQGDTDAMQVLGKLNSVGCGYEGGALSGYFAVNVPKGVHMNKVAAILSPLEDCGKVFSAYPADRHQ